MCACVEVAYKFLCPHLGGFAALMFIEIVNYTENIPIKSIIIIIIVAIVKPPRNYYNIIKSANSRPGSRSLNTKRSNGRRN